MSKGRHGRDEGGQIGRSRSWRVTLRILNFVLRIRVKNGVFQQRSDMIRLPGNKLIGCAADGALERGESS